MLGECGARGEAWLPTSSFPHTLAVQAMPSVLQLQNAFSFRNVPKCCDRRRDSPLAHFGIQSSRPTIAMAEMKQTADDVTRTWALVAAGPLEPVGVAFFLKIFEIAPEALRALPAPIQPSHPRRCVSPAPVQPSPN